MSDITSETSEASSRYEIYQDTAGEFRWRLKAGNNEIVGDSSEGYTTRLGAIRAAKSVQRWATTDTFIDQTGQ